MYDTCLRILVSDTRTYLDTCVMTGLHGREHANASIASLTSLHAWRPPKNWQNVSPLLLVLLPMHLFHTGQLQSKSKKAASMSKATLYSGEKQVEGGGGANHLMERTSKRVQSALFKLLSCSNLDSFVCRSVWKILQSHKSCSGVLFSVVAH